MKKLVSVLATMLLSSSAFAASSFEAKCEANILKTLSPEATVWGIEVFEVRANDSSILYYIGMKDPESGVPVLTVQAKVENNTCKILEAITVDAE